MENLVKRFLPLGLIHSADALLPVIVVMSVIMMVIPFPPWALDIFIAFSLSAALITIVMTMYISGALEFSVFPTWVLIVTIFRIALNVSTTRSILSQADAGRIIGTFGEWVIGGSVVVGIVIFIILVAVNYIVIANGAQRIGEVAARFTLDAMPGKQMSIDADLTNGLITEDEARARRSNLEREADYFGAMDGAARYVKGDAIVGIIITIINLGAGFIIGMVQKGYSASEAFEIYSRLTIGDGLQGQIPALLMSVATGVIVTNAATDVNISQGLVKQIAAQPRSMLVTAGAISFIALLPGMPKFILFPIAALLGVSAYYLLKTVDAQLESAAPSIDDDDKPKPTSTEETYDILSIDPLELDLGYSLVPLVTDSREGDLLQKVSGIRRSIAQELGFVIPPIRIRDNIGLKPQEYQIKLKGNPVAQYEVQADRLLAINPGNIDEDLPGSETKDPTFGLKAFWIPEEVRPQAEVTGFLLVDPAGVIITHLTYIIKLHADELLDRESTKALVEKVKETHPTVVEELTPSGLSLGEIQKVLRFLLSEGISIRSLPEILEVLADRIALTKDPATLTEYVRSALARQISAKIADLGQGTARIITVSSHIEEMLTQSIRQTAAGEIPVLTSATIEKIKNKLNKLLEKVETLGLKAVILVSPRNRLPLRNILAKDYPDLMVVSFGEIVSDLPLEAIGTLDLSEDNNENQTLRGSGEGPSETNPPG